MKKFFKLLSSAVFATAVTLLPTIAFTSCSDDDEDVPKVEEPTDPKPETTNNVEMLGYWDCNYFLPATYDYGNYAVQLRTGEVGMSGFLYYPLNPGDYVLDLDMNAALDPNHKSPTLPEGVYHATNDPAKEHDLTFSLAYTVAIYNVETTDDGQSRMQHIYFSDGTVEVKHTAEGYVFDCNFIAKEDGAKWHFTYKGELEFNDRSGIDDEDWWGFEGATSFTAAKANSYYYDESATLGLDNYILRLFENENITADFVHPATVGNKVQLSIYTKHNNGLEGTYTVSDKIAANTCLPGERIATMAASSFVERVRDDFKVRYALISEGEITIAKQSDDTYKVTVDCKTSEGETVNVTYSGVIEDITNVTPVYSTLESDITVTPTECTAVDYYGDYYGNGTRGYGLYLANESELLAFDIIAASGSASELPTGTYTVGTGYTAGTMLPGSIDDETITPTAYVAYNTENGTAVNYAPVTGGTLTITKNDKGVYTFSFNLEDDANPAHKITGSMSGTIPAIKDYTTNESTSVNSKTASLKIRH